VVVDVAVRMDGGVGGLVRGESMVVMMLVVILAVVVVVAEWDLSVQPAVRMLRRPSPAESIAGDAGEGAVDKLAEGGPGQRRLAVLGAHAHVILVDVFLGRGRTRIEHHPVRLLQPEDDGLPGVDVGALLSEVTGIGRWMTSALVSRGG
jgi:hypothetical protein